MINPNGPESQQVVRFVEIGPGQQRLEPGCQHFRVHLERARRLLEENGFPCFRFDHQKTQSRHRQRERNGRGPAATSDVHHPGSPCRRVSRGYERLDEEAIEAFRRGVSEVHACQVDLLVPGGEQAEIGFELGGKLSVYGQSGAPGAASQPVLELAAVHGRNGSGIAPSAAGSGESRPRNAPKTATAAGVIPGIRDAWPSVSGRTCDRRWIASRDSPGTRVNGNPAGMRFRSCRLARATRDASCFRYPSYLIAVSTLARSRWRQSAAMSRETSPRSTRSQSLTPGCFRTSAAAREPLAVRICVKRRRAALRSNRSRRDENLSHRSSLISPSSRPNGVSRRSALSIRRRSRCSARDVNMR